MPAFIRDIQFRISIGSACASESRAIERVSNAVLCGAHNKPIDVFFERTRATECSVVLCAIHHARAVTLEYVIITLLFRCAVRHCGARARNVPPIAHTTE